MPNFEAPKEAKVVIAGHSNVSQSISHVLNVVKLFLSGSKTF